MNSPPKKVVPNNLLTIYGRKPVLEALQDKSITFYKVHFADSNQRSGIVKDIEMLCNKRNIPIDLHDRMALSRISKNRKQDQGIAADILTECFQTLPDYLASRPEGAARLIGLENVTNPQNLGMIIRSVAASPVDGLLLPRKGCARLDALVIKASAGTVFKAPLIFCDDILQATSQLKAAGFSAAGLALQNSQPLASFKAAKQQLYLLGNETDGLSDSLLSLCDHNVCIPMRRNIESLNVAVTAALLAFLPGNIS